MNLIGLLGHAGVGKDTVAAMILKLAPGRTVALAEPLKRFCKEVFAFSDEQLYGPSAKRNVEDRRYGRYDCEACGDGYAGEREPVRGIAVDDDGCCVSCGVEAQLVYLTPRFALQLLGTEWGRACYPDVWIDLGVRTARSVIGGGAVVVVITDCRFINEARGVRAAGGVVWRIVRPGSAVSGAIAAHVSEAEQDRQEIQPYVSRTIVNDGTLVELEAKVVAAVADWRGR